MFIDCWTSGLHGEARSLFRTVPQHAGKSLRVANCFSSFPPLPFLTCLQIPIMSATVRSELTESEFARCLIRLNLVQIVWGHDCQRGTLLAFDHTLYTQLTSALIIEWNSFGPEFSSVLFVSTTLVWRSNYFVQRFANVQSALSSWADICALCIFSRQDWRANRKIQTWRIERTYTNSASHLLALNWLHTRGVSNRKIALCGFLG